MGCPGAPGRGQQPATQQQRNKKRQKTTRHSKARGGGRSPGGGHVRRLLGRTAAGAQPPPAGAAAAGWALMSGHASRVGAPGAVPACLHAGGRQGGQAAGACVSRLLERRRHASARRLRPRQQRPARLALLGPRRRSRRGAWPQPLRKTGAGSAGAAARETPGRPKPPARARTRALAGQTSGAGRRALWCLRVRAAPQDKCISALLKCSEGRRPLQRVCMCLGPAPVLEGPHIRHRKRLPGANGALKTQHRPSNGAARHGAASRRRALRRRHCGGAGGGSGHGGLARPVALSLLGHGC